MFLNLRFFAILTLFTLGSADPVPLRSVEAYNGEKTGRMIVQVKQGISSRKLVKSLGLRLSHEYEYLNSFAGQFDEATLNAIRASPDVESIAEDGIMYAMAAVNQINAPWNLAALSSATPLPGTDTSATNYTYTYDSSAGRGVDIYILDTGVYANHSDFGGRAGQSVVFGGYADTDGNGHGTHCAGVAAGTRWGVSKLSNIISVKVLSDSGSGTVADIVNGMNWVISQAASSGRPAVVSMSVGGGASTAMDNAVATLTNANIHVVVAAGGSNTDAANTSPARAPSAITVGSATITNTRASFSNYGSVIDIWAPGQNIISAWIGSTTATNNISGTSTSAPHVAGAVAYLIALCGNRTPAQMVSLLKANAISGRLTGIPSGTINNFLHIPLSC